MEMRITGSRLGGAVQQTAAAAEKKTSTGGQGQTKVARDTVELSQRVTDLLNEQAKRTAEAVSRLGSKEEDENGGTSMLDSYKKQLDIMNKCAKISASISAGDRVPPEDLRYLKEHDMNAYRLAMATRKPKHDPKDKETVLSEEDIKELEGGGESTASGAAPAVSAAGGAEGSGGASAE